MSAHDDDILDFDFFDDEAPDGSGRRPEEPRRPSDDGGPRPPRFRPPGNAMPLLRLVGLVAFAILIAVLLIVWAQGCAGDRQRESYEDFMGEMTVVGSDSAQIGDRLADLLITPGLKQAELEQKLSGLVEQQELGVTRAESIDAPGQVFRPYEAALEALRFRVAGLQGLLDTFVATKDAKDAAVAGAALSAQGQRLITSDVIWSDLFKAGSEAELEAEDVTGVAVPASVFVDNADLYSTRSMTAIWQRVHGASTGGETTGLHGTALGAVVAQPSGQQLSVTEETTIVASTELAFDVSVTNSGDNQEVSIAVDFQILGPGTPIKKQAKIDLLDPGETTTVQFTDFPEIPFGEKVSVKVDVQPVKGETNTTNNTGEFPVIFSFGQ